MRTNAVRIAWKTTPPSVARRRICDQISRGRIDRRFRRYAAFEVEHSARSPSACSAVAGGTNVRAADSNHRGGEYGITSLRSVLADGLPAPPGSIRNRAPEALHGFTDTPGREDGLVQRTLAGGQQAVVPLRPAAALGRRVRQPRFDELLVLQPIERGVDGAEGDVLWRCQFADPLTNSDPIRGVGERQDGRQHELFELTNCGLN